MWSCPPVLCAGRDRARASGGRKKLKGATLTSSRVAPSDRAGPGWVPGWRLELADHLVAVRSWLLHEPDLGLAKDDGARDWRGTRQRVNRPSRFGQESRISGVAERYCVIPFLLPPPKNPCPARAEKASQAGRRRFDPGRPLSPLAGRKSRSAGGVFAVRVLSVKGGRRGPKATNSAAEKFLLLLDRGGPGRGFGAA